METTTETKVPILILELTDRAKSGFVKKGTEHTPYEQRLDGPAKHRILSTSSYLDAEGGLVPIRYIAGRPEILVSVQEDRKIKPNPKADHIVFEGPIMTVLRVGKDIGKYDYLSKCHYNQHAPNKPNEDFIRFREIRTEEVAKMDLSEIKLKDRVFSILSELFEEGEDGDYTYDTARLHAVCQALGIQQPTDAEKVSTLRSFAEANPAVFIKTLSDRTMDYKNDIADAIRLNVIQVAGKIVTLVSSNETIFTLKASAKAQQQEELARLLMFPDNAITYKAIMAAVGIAKEAQANPA